MEQDIVLKQAVPAYRAISLGSRDLEYSGAYFAEGLELQVFGPMKVRINGQEFYAVCIQNFVNETLRTLYVLVRDIEYYNFVH